MKSLGSKAQGARLERMRSSPLWAGQGFRNAQAIRPGLRDPEAKMPTFTEWLFGTKAQRVPARALPSLDPLQAWRHASHSGLRATWLGHSTVLIEIGGVRILTDPVWAARASPSALVGPRRFQPVPVALRRMPPLDLVVVSHDHYDHLDYPTIRALARRDVPFVTSLGVGAHLESWGVRAERITELDWWESYDLPRAGVRVTATPAQHFSGRTLKTRNATLWSSFVVQSDHHRIFFSGDTGLTPEYARIGAEFGPFDLLMLEVGGWHPAWGDMHLGPYHALEAVDLLGGGVFLPVHWGTFTLAMHAWNQPAEVLLELTHTSTARLLMPKLGEAVEPDDAPEDVDPWWRSVLQPSGRVLRRQRLAKSVP